MKKLLLISLVLLSACTAQNNPPKRVSNKIQGLYYLNQVKALEVQGMALDSMDKIGKFK